MAVNLKGRSFLTLEDFTPAEIRYLLDLGHDLKAKRRAGICDPALKGKHIVLLFEKTSTRTRCSFEVAATQEGAHVTYLDANSSQMGKKESLEDSAKVLGRMFDGIEYRGYAQSAVEDLAKYSGVPVWNGLTDADHPTQILADMMTIEEHCHKPLNQVKVVFPGDVRNNMCYAWMIGAAKMGMHFVAMGPEQLAKEMDKALIQRVFATARENGGLIEITVLMNDGSITDTILHWGEEALSGAGPVSFVLLVYLIYLPLTVLIPSSSGLATLSVPVMAPLGRFAGVGGDLVVTAFQSASGLVNIITPTAAVVMGALALGHVPYDRWVKYVWKLILYFLLLTMVFLVAGVLLG